MGVITITNGRHTSVGREQGLQRDGKDGCHGTKGSDQQVPPPVTHFPHLTPPPQAQDVARRILAEDVTQIDYTTERVKRMVGKVLTGTASPPTTKAPTDWWAARR